MNMKKICKIGAALALFALYIAYFIAVQPGYASYPGLNKGEIYITDESFYNNSELFLAGDWEFYFGELTDSEGFNAKKQKNYYTLPDYWQRDWNDKSVEINGYGSYRVLITFETPKESISLGIPWVFGAYEVYANGASVLQCGSVGTDPPSEIPDTRSQSVVIPLGSDKLELIIHVSGHISGLSGLYHPISIGSDASVSHYAGIHIALDAIFIGCFLIMGFYHLAIFFLRKKDKATLCFALFCFAALVRQGTISQGLLFDILPPDNGYLAYDIYALSNVWAVVFFGLFSWQLFGKKYGTGYKNILVFVTSCVIKTGMEIFRQYNFSYPAFFVSYVCFTACIVYIARVIYLLIRRGDRYGFIYIYGVLFLALGNGTDVLTAFGFIRTDDIMGNTAYVIITFIETVILARMYTNFSYENERLLKHMESLVVERTAELAGANEQLLLMEQTKNELISNISHDLRTPMTAIRGYMELLMDGIHEGTEHQEYIESAHTRMEQMENLIKDLFLLTQLTEKSTLVEITPVKISEFLAKCYKNYKPIAKQKGIGLTLKDGSGHASVRADKNFLLRIMDNLMQNALYYAKSSIIIAVKIEDKTVVFGVTDDGEGIDKDSLPYVFDRFFKKRKDGAGLGLCIVKELATAMGGEVFADSIPNEYTEFRVKFNL